MESSILQKHWIEQEKQRPFFSSSHSSIATVDQQYDRLTNRLDVLSSESFFRTDLQSISNSSPSPSTTKIKEFCPTEEDEDDDSSFKRFIYHHLSLPSSSIVFTKYLRIY